MITQVMMKFATLIVLFVKLSLKAVQLHLVFPVSILRLHQKSEKKLANITLDKFSHIYQAVENMETKLNKKRFSNYRKTFSSCTYYIFFVHFVFQQFNLNNQINIAMKKNSRSSTFFTEHLRASASETVGNNAFYKRQNSHSF